VDEGEHPHLGLAGELGCLDGGRVARLGRPLRLVRGEGPVVDQQLGLMRRDPRHLGRAAVAGDYDLPPPPGLAEDLIGAHRSLRPLDRLAALKPAEVAHVGDTESAGALLVEPARSLLLDQRIAVGLDPVFDRERPHLIAVVRNRLPGSDLDQLELVGGPADDRPHRLHQLPEPGGPQHPQRLLPPGEGVGAQQPRQPEVVVGMEVAEIDLVELDQPGRAHHLALGALPRVEQQPVTAAADQEAGGRAPRRGYGAAGAEEDGGEVHDPPSVGVSGIGGREPAPAAHLHLSRSRP
jgi:hypothetical protein